MRQLDCTWPQRYAEIKNWDRQTNKWKKNEENKSITPPQNTNTINVNPIPIGAKAPANGSMLPAAPLEVATTMTKTRRRVPINSVRWGATYKSVRCLKWQEHRAHNATVKKKRGRGWQTFRRAESNKLNDFSPNLWIFLDALGSCNSLS